MQKLGDDCSTIFLNGNARVTFGLYKALSAHNHSASDDTTLRKTLIMALNAPLSAKQSQEDSCFRYPINNGKGYLVYKLGVVRAGPAAGGGVVANSAGILHYHWNYNLDKDLTH